MYWVEQILLQDEGDFLRDGMGGKDFMEIKGYIILDQFIQKFFKFVFFVCSCFYICYSELLEEKFQLKIFIFIVCFGVIVN